jgi:peptidoglycan/LPS O-acetylase OafA/YrhL
VASDTFFKHLNAFRGFAILNIVAAHSWSILLLIPSPNKASTESMFIHSSSETLFHNSTIYFAIISGLLFSLVLKKYSWKEFYLKKLKNVVVPYIFFSVVYGFISGMLIIDPSSKPMELIEVIQALPRQIVAGTSFAHMWYIPVLIALFLMTPIFQIIVSNKKLNHISIFIIIIPLFISRSFPDFVWQNFVFFFGPYVFGMLVGNNYLLVQSIIEKNRWGLIITAVICTVILAYLYLIDLEAIYGVKLQESVSYIHKLAIGFLVLNLLYLKEKKSPKLLQYLAKYSFSIYFIHMFFAAMFSFIMVSMGLTSPSSFGILLSGLLVFFITIIVSVGVTLLIKRLSGQYSRYIVGS